MWWDLPLFLAADTIGADPNKDPGVTWSPEILDTAQKAGQAVFETYQQDWEDLASGNNFAYKTIVALCVPLATIAIAWWGLNWQRELSERGLTIDALEAVIWPVLVCLMLGVNNGALLAHTSYAFHAIENGMSEKILNGTRNGVSYREAIRETHANQALSQEFKARIDECQKLSTSGTDSSGNPINPRNVCTKEETDKALETARKYRQDNGLGHTGDIDGFWSFDPRGVLGAIINNTVQALLFMALSAMESIAIMFMQKAFLLISYMAPVALVFSLPIRTGQPIFAWLSGWLGLSIWHLGFNIIVGDIATTIVNSPQENPLLMLFVEGLAAPVLAGLLGGWSAMAIFSGFTSVSRTAITGF